jgi:hypothetical protein
MQPPALGLLSNPSVNVDGELIPPHNGSRPHWKRILYPILGLILLVGGIIGQLLPIIPGIPLSIVGLVLLAFTSETVRKAINRFDKKLSAKRRQTLRRWMHKLPLKSLQTADRS